jgi:hypothetical protein
MYSGPIKKEEGEKKVVLLRRSLVRLCSILLVAIVQSKILNKTIFGEVPNWTLTFFSSLRLFCRRYSTGKKKHCSLRRMGVRGTSGHLLPLSKNDLRLS